MKYRALQFPLLSTVLALLFLFEISSAIGADLTPKESASSWKFSLDVKTDKVSHFATEMSSMGSWPNNSFANQNLLETREFPEQRILFLHLKRQAGDGSLTLSKYQFGYGSIMDCESSMTTCSNGAAWEEPNCVFVKYCMNF